MVRVFGFGDRIRKDPVKMLGTLGFDVAYHGTDILWTFSISEFASLSSSSDPEKELGSCDFLDLGDHLGDLPQWFQSEVLRAASAELGTPLGDIEHVVKTKVFKQLQSDCNEVFEQLWVDYVWDEYRQAFALASEFTIEDGKSFSYDLIDDNGIDHSNMRVQVTMPKSFLLDNWAELVENIGDGSARAVDSFLKEHIGVFPFNYYDLAERWGDYLSDGGFDAAIDAIARKFYDVFPDFHGPVDAPGQMHLFGDE